MTQFFKLSWLELWGPEFIYISVYFLFRPKDISVLKSIASRSTLKLHHCILCLSKPQIFKSFRKCDSVSHYVFNITLKQTPGQVVQAPIACDKTRWLDEENKVMLKCIVIAKYVMISCYGYMSCWHQTRLFFITWKKFRAFASSPINWTEMVTLLNLSSACTFSSTALHIFLEVLTKRT